MVTLRTIRFNTRKFWFSLHSLFMFCVYLRTKSVYFQKEHEVIIFRRVRKTAKIDCWLRHARPSVRPHGTTLLTLDGFSWNLIFEYFSKICRENSGFIKIWQEERLLHINTHECLWCVSMRIFETKVTEEIKTYINNFFPKIVSFMRYVQILWGETGHRWENNTAHAVCMLDN